MSQDPGLRTYIAADVAGFMKTAEAHGGFSNMAGGYPITINDTLVRSSEAYYQAMRFPDNPEAQAAILSQTSGMYAKRKAYEFIGETRADWREVNVAIMKHALNLKLCHNREKVLALHAGAAGRDIVEISHRDPWWGAKPEGNRLIGCNVLGRLHMGQRATLEENPDFCLDGVDAPGIPNLRLLGQEIGFTPSRDRAFNALQMTMAL